MISICNEGTINAAYYAHVVSAPNMISPTRRACPDRPDPCVRQRQVTDAGPREDALGLLARWRDERGRPLDDA